MSTELIKKTANGTSFAQLQKIYGLKTPEQIKLRLIWDHTQMLMRQTFGESPKNLKLLKKYDARFRVCEAEEFRKH